MGWRELRAWLRVMRRQQEGPKASPHAWNEASRANFEDLDAKRRALRGR